MDSALPEAAVADRRRWWSRWPVLVAAVVLVAVVVIVALVVRSKQQPSGPPLALRQVGAVSLPGDTSRFDYASLDAQRGLLFIAHLGASEVVEVDVRAQRVVRTIPNLDQAHGVLVVPELRRVFVTATGSNSMVTLDEQTGQVLHNSPTGEYPDGLAYDPGHNAVWTTNEAGGSETVIDADTGAVRGTVELGGEVGNVVYGQATDQMLVAVQGTNELAVIDPAALTVIRRIPLSGCEHPHGLAQDHASPIVFVGCDHNATLLTVDLTTSQVTGTATVGQDPDVLAFDQGTHRLYVAAESGTVAVLDQQDRTATVVAIGHLADGAHIVVVDPATHHTYFPIPKGADGGPTLLEQDPI